MQDIMFQKKKLDVNDISKSNIEKINKIMDKDFNYFNYNKISITNI